VPELLTLKGILGPLKVLTRFSKIISFPIHLSSCIDGPLKHPLISSYVRKCGVRLKKILLKSQSTLLFDRSATWIATVL
jgi:hypothetical protein